MICNLVFVSLWGGGRISLANLYETGTSAYCNIVQSCEIQGTGNYVVQNRKRKSCIWIFNLY